MEIVEPRSKYCKCGNEKDTLRKREYSKYGIGKLYYHSECSKCHRERMREALPDYRTKRRAAAKLASS